MVKHHFLESIHSTPGRVLCNLTDVRLLRFKLPHMVVPLAVAMVPDSLGLTLGEDAIYIITKSSVLNGIQLTDEWLPADGLKPSERIEDRFDLGDA